MDNEQDKRAEWKTKIEGWADDIRAKNFDNIFLFIAECLDETFVGLQHLRQGVEDTVEDWLRVIRNDLTAWGHMDAEFMLADRIDGNFYEIVDIVVAKTKTNITPIDIH